MHSLAKSLHPSSNPQRWSAKGATDSVLLVNAYLSFLLSSVRPFVIPTVLTFSLLALGCGGPATGVGGTGGEGAGGAAAPECLSDQDCLELYDLEGGVACDADGECFECEHEDPFGGPVQTPEFWEPDQFESGADLALDPRLAYWALPLAEYGLQGQPTPNAVLVCAPMSVEDGEVVDTGSDCETLDANDFIHDGASLIVPVAPSAWLSSDPLNGLYYTEVNFEFGPIYLCP